MWNRTAGTQAFRSFAAFRLSDAHKQTGEGDLVPASGIHFERMARLVAGALLCAGLSGCYVPNGGWTLRSGLDCRTHRKPAMFIEMVDTRWDEWNRVAQINALQPAWEPPSAQHLGSQAGPSSAPSSSHQEPAQLPAVPESSTASAHPAGGWLFRR